MKIKDIDAAMISEAVLTICVMQVSIDVLVGSSSLMAQYTSQWLFSFLK